MANFPQQFGAYTLHELIARGGMAEVYRATMPGVGGFEKTVAIKKILPHLSENDEFIAMLVDEARIIVGLNHANIAQVYDLGCIDDTYYIAMEYVHSVDLAEMIKELKKAGQTMPLSHSVYIASCICAGLHVAHSKVDETGRAQHIVHRDVSPHNVLISFGGDVKIIDFGVAKARGKENHTKAGVIKGKLLYMAPEQAMAKEIDGRSDLFAVGIILYNMLTGHLPFDGENEFQIYNNILSREIPPPRAFNPEIPEELNQIVMMMLQRDPDKRYQDGYTCKLELDRVLHGIAPGYAISRLSNWVEDNFSHILQARRQRRENRSGQNPMPQTPSRPVNQTGPGLYSGEPMGQSDRFPQAPMVPSAANYSMGASGSFPQQQIGPSGFPNSSPSGSFPATGSGGFPAMNTGGFAAVSPSGQWPAANGFPNGVGTSGEIPSFTDGNSQSFQTQVSADQTGNFESSRRGRIPLIPLIGSGVMVLFIVGLVAMNALKEKPVAEPEIVEPVGTEPEGEKNPVMVVEEDREEPVEEEVEEVVEVAEVDMVTIQIGSKPEGATLLVGGEDKGKTPVTLEMPRSGEGVFVELTLEGYESDGFRLVPAEDTERSFVLAELPKEEPPKVEPKKITKKTTKTTKKSTKETTKSDEDDLFTVPLLPATKKTPKKAEEDDELMNPF